jgi:threonine/homoserine/homoserine lactone efflux protein
MLAYLLQGLGLGAAAGAQPGPFQAYLINQAVRVGWRRTLLAAFAPLVSDGPIIALVLLVLSQGSGWMSRLLNAAGGIFILFLAWDAARAWLRFNPHAASPPPDSQNLWRAALMNILNPNPYIFWSLVTGPILLRGWRETPLNGLGFLLGFYAALVGINMAVIVISGAARQSGAGFRRGALGLSALALGAFGLVQLWRAVAG